MRKRFCLILFIIILISGLSTACISELKAVNRASSGTATLTPFLVKATYTSESPPMEMAGGGEASDPEYTSTPGSSVQEETSQGEATSEFSPTPSSTPTPNGDPSQPTESANTSTPTDTVKPTKPPATAVPTKPPSTSTPKPTRTPTRTPTDTYTPGPPPDTNTPSPPTATPTPAECVSSGNTSYENQVITLINQERTDRGLPALVQNTSLTQAARRHSLDMACNDQWSHTGSDGSSPFSRMLDAGYVYSWAAENIAASSSQYFSPASVVNMWMNSDGHRANILSPKAVHIGVGFRYAGDVDILPYDAYYTADFGKP